MGKPKIQGPRARPNGFRFSERSVGGLGWPALERKRKMHGVRTQRLILRKPRRHMRNTASCSQPSEVEGDQHTLGGELSGFTLLS